MTNERKVIDQMAEALGARPTKVIELYQSWSQAISTWPPSIQLQASQLVGIAYRLESDYPAAINAFENALMFADLLEDTVKVSAILRDQAMVYLKMAELEPGSKGSENYFQSAYKCLEESLRLLENEGVDDEYYATKGFIGRYYLSVGDKESARRQFSSCDQYFKERSHNKNYQLNNLMLLFSITLWPIRWKFMPRLVMLTVKTGQRRRLPQIVALAIGGKRLEEKARRFR